MGDRTAIEWAEATQNFWRGCDKVSPGCAHCYMFDQQRMYGRDPSVVVRCSKAVFFAPVRARKWLDLPPGSHVFTCSWSDFFHETADPWRGEAWEVIRARPDLIWQILTKRPERVLEHLPADWGAGWPNVWMGVSIENRRFVDRADLLRQIPAAVRFISAEPLLAPLRMPDCDCLVPCLEGAGQHSPGCACLRWRDGSTAPELNLTGIDWLIVGGESGPKARPMRLEWARDLRDACNAAGVAFFLKQLGGPSRHKRGGAEALLDGRRWTEMP